MTSKTPESKVVIALKKFFKSQPDFFDVHVIEASANFDEKAGRYTKGAVAPGYPDMSGNDKYGHALYIEVKAKGKLHTLKPAQYIFLERKISLGCFAACVDSVESFKTIYKTWLGAQPEKKQSYLMRHLKKPKMLRDLEDDEPLFPE